MNNNQFTLRNGEEISVRECTIDDLDKILTLQEEVIQSLTEESFLQPLSSEEFLHILHHNGLLIGAYSQDEIVAFRALLIPSTEEEEHLGEDAGIPKEQWHSIIYSEVSNVKPSFRGNGLQKLLGKIIIDKVDQSRYRYVCATVAPFNIASLLDKFALGMQMVELKEKYNQMMRYIFVKDFLMQEQNYEKQELVNMENTKKQQELLDAGWRGTGIKQVNDKWMVVFQV